MPLTVPSCGNFQPSSLSELLKGYKTYFLHMVLWLTNNINYVQLILDTTGISNLRKVIQQKRPCLAPPFKSNKSKRDFFHGFIKNSWKFVKTIVIFLIKKTRAIIWDYYTFSNTVKNLRILAVDFSSNNYLNYNLKYSFIHSFIQASIHVWDVGTIV